MLKSVRTGVSGVVLAAAMLAGGAAHADGTLNFYNWSDYIGEDTIPGFEKETGIKVNYDVYDSNDVLEAKMLAGNSGYDLIVPTALPALARLIQAGAVQKLDKSKIPNLKNLDPKLMERVKSADPNLEYAAIWQWGTNGIGYNVDKVKERLGADFPLDSWDLVFKPEVAAKLADCGITMLDSPEEVIPLAMNYAGFNPNAEDAKALAAAEKTLLAVRPSVRYFHSSKYITDLANGEVCVSIGFSGDIFQAQSRAEEAKNGVNIEYMIPKEGALIWFDTMAIPAGAPNVENAYKFINFALQPKVMAGISDYVSYANAVPASLKLMDQDIVNNPSIFPPAEVQAKLFPGTLYSPRFTREMTRVWTKMRTGE